MCGKGFGSFTIWDVSVSYLPSGAGEVGMEGGYSDHWEVVGACSIGSPIFIFGFFAPNRTSSGSEAIVLGGDKQFLKSFTFSINAANENTGGEEKEGSLVMSLDFDIGVESPKAHSGLIMSSGRPIRPPLHSGLACRILCASADGNWMFGGLDELIVYRYKNLA